MTDLNCVVLVGRLTRDIEVKYSKSSAYPVGHLSLAVNRNRKNGDNWVEEASFFDVTLFGQTADRLKTKLVKGTSVAIQGYLQQDRWEKDGKNFSRVVVVADTIQLVGGNNSGNGAPSNAGGYSQSYGQPAAGAAPSFGAQPFAPSSTGFAPQMGNPVQSQPTYEESSGYPDEIPW